MMATHPTHGRRTTTNDQGRSRAESVIAILAASALLAAVALSARPAPDARFTAAVRVQAGDTLWAIAAQHPVDGLTTAQTADLISEMNKLRGASLRPGDELRVPAAPATDVAVAMR